MYVSLLMLSNLKHYNKN